VTKEARIVRQKEKLARVLGRSAGGVQCNCGQYHFVGGKVTAVRFMGEASMDLAIKTWDPLDPLLWDLQITPEDDGSGNTQVWYAGLSHVMSESEIRSLFEVLN
jgi:hypothetical protein